MKKSRRCPDVSKRIGDVEIAVWLAKGDISQSMSLRFYYRVDGEEKIASCFKPRDIKDIVACLNWLQSNEFMEMSKMRMVLKEN